MVGGAGEVIPLQKVCVCVGGGGGGITFSHSQGGAHNVLR